MSDIEFLIVYRLVPFWKKTAARVLLLKYRIYAFFRERRRAR